MTQLEGAPGSKQDRSYQKVLVTGGLGFIGAFVCDRLLKQENGPDVVILDRYSYAADQRRLDRLGGGKKPTLIRGDIRNEKDVRTALEGCDAVVHLAAETHVTRSYTEPRNFFDTNVTGTENLLNAVQSHQVKHFVHISSAAVYGAVTDDVDENTPVKPTSPYAMAKASAEEAVMLAAYGDLRASILRPVNAIGIGQNPEKMFPKFFMQAMRGKPLTIEGSGFQERSFVPASDLAAAIELVLIHESKAQTAVFNVPGQEKLSVLEAAKLIFEVTGRTPCVSHVTDRERNDMAVRVDGSRLKALGYNQQSSVKKELAEIQRDFLSRAWLQSGRP